MVATIGGGSSKKSDKADKADKADKSDDADEDKPAKKAKKGGGDDADEDKPAKKAKADDADEDKPAKKAKADDEDKSDQKGDDEEAPHKAKKRSAHRGDDDDGGDVEASAEVGGVHGPAHAANLAAIRVNLGLSVMTRSLKFVSRTFDQAPNGYTGKPVPGGRIEGELYPAAFGNAKSPAAWIGVGGMYDKTLSLSLTSDGQPGTKFPVKEYQWEVGARVRIPFGTSPTAPTLTLIGDYGHRTFIIDRSALMDTNVIDVPDTDYKGYFPGAMLRVPLAPAVALFAGGQAALVTGAGQIVTADQYGQAKITGGTGTAGLDVVLGSKIALRFSGEFTQMGYKFSGTGKLTNNRDGDPTTPDVGGASDRYIGGAATLAVFY
jgi:hypothetical protein